MVWKLSVCFGVSACAMLTLWPGHISAGTFTVADREELLQLTAKLQASQFLTHATFGPTEAEIDSLAARIRAVGTVNAANEWLDRQTNPAAANYVGRTLHEATAEAMVAQDLTLCQITTDTGAPITPLAPPIANGAATYVPYPYDYRSYAWWQNAIAGPDQLRQKVAWSLNQILVVSTINGDFNDPTLDSPGAGPNGTLRKPRYLGISNYYDIFVDQAFGSYREILQRVTHHAVMGDWLSFRSNSKAVPAENRFPDENFAREVMQLFTIGLYALNDDGTHVLDAQGRSMATYNNADIREYAKVFTGLGYNGSGGAYNTVGDNTSFVSAQRYGFPMTMAKVEHELGSKRLLNTTLTALPNNATRAQCNADITSALDGLLAHRSCPPFICHQLIQRLVKSNPSRAYLNRVVQVFKNNGQNVRGDLKAVVRAILLDAEAWSPIRTQYLRNPNRILVTTMGTEDSKLQEPVVNFTRILRGLNARAVYERGTTQLNAQQNGTETVWNTTPLSNAFRIHAKRWEFEQSAYMAPSVFNFYLPSYQPAGDIAGYTPSSRQPLRKIAAPEFQVMNAITIPRTANLIHWLVAWGPMFEGLLSEGYFDGGNPTATPPVPPSVKNSFTVLNGNEITTILHPTRCRVFVDDTSGYQALGRFAVMARTMPNQAGGSAKLIERLDLLFCQGTLNDSYRSKLLQVLDAQRTDAGATVNQDEAFDLARAAVLAVIDSPSFLVSK
jgi:uncharacterized protein (DUF1800 family)